MARVHVQQEMSTRDRTQRVVRMQVISDVLEALCIVDLFCASFFRS